MNNFYPQFENYNPSICFIDPPLLISKFIINEYDKTLLEKEKKKNTEEKK